MEAFDRLPAARCSLVRKKDPGLVESAWVREFYSTAPDAPDPELQARAASIAGHAAGALSLALRLAERDDLIGNLRLAMRSRSSIDQTIGILMAQQRCSAHAAFELMRSASQGRNIKWRDVAAGIVAGMNRAASENPKRGPLLTSPHHQGSRNSLTGRSALQQSGMRPVQRSAPCHDARAPSCTTRRRSPPSTSHPDAEAARTSRADRGLLGRHVIACELDPRRTQARPRCTA